MLRPIVLVLGLSIASCGPQKIELADGSCERFPSVTMFKVRSCTHMPGCHACTAALISPVTDARAASGFGLQQTPLIKPIMRLLGVTPVKAPTGQSSVACLCRDPSFQTAQMAVRL
jgi:hypothetical protein